MKSCAEWEGFIAQSLYEPLETKEQLALEQHLFDCSACRTELASLQKLTQAIPDEPIVFTGDLRRSLEDEVRAMAPVKSISFQWFSPIKALAFVLFLMVGLSGYSHFHTKKQETPTAILVAETTELIAQQKYTRAYMLLNEHLNNPVLAQNLETAKVQGILAELAFSRLGLYEEAHEAFEILRTQHPKTFNASEDYQRTFMILEEARGIQADYAALRDWDQLNGHITVAALEQYIEKYPGTHQATEAVHNIARCMIQYADVDYLEMNKALEFAIVDHKNPLVVAQIKLELGRFYLDEEYNPKKATRILREVIASPIPVLSEQATVTLAKLEN